MIMACVYSHALLKQVNEEVPRCFIAAVADDTTFVHDYKTALAASDKFQQLLEADGLKTQPSKCSLTDVSPEGNGGEEAERKRREASSSSGTAPSCSAWW